MLLGASGVQQHSISIWPQLTAGEQIKMNCVATYLGADEHRDASSDDAVVQSISPTAISLKLHVTDPGLSYTRNVNFTDGTFRTAAGSVLPLGLFLAARTYTGSSRATISQGERWTYRSSGADMFGDAGPRTVTVSSVTGDDVVLAVQAEGQGPGAPGPADSSAASTEQSNSQAKAEFSNGILKNLRVLTHETVQQGDAQQSYFTRTNCDVGIGR